MTARRRIENLTRLRNDRVLRRTQLRQAIPGPTTYAGEGRVQSLGGNPVPVRGSQPNSFSVGEPVAISQGLIGTSGNGTTGGLIEQNSRLAHIANRRGIQLFSGDPNDVANDGEGRAYQAYDRQLLYNGSDGVSGGLYYHQPATEGNPDKWVPMLHEELNGFIPEVGQDFVYPLISSAEFPAIVTRFSIRVGASTAETTTADDTTLTVGSTTVVLSTAIGAELAQAGRLTLTPTATDGTALEFTIGFTRS